MTFAPSPPWLVSEAPPCAPYRVKVAEVMPGGTVQVWALPVSVKVQVTVGLPVQSPEAALAGSAGSAVTRPAAPRVTAASTGRRNRLGRNMQSLTLGTATRPGPA